MVAGLVLAVLVPSAMSVAVTVRLLPQPEAVRTLLVAFRSMEDGSRAVSAIIAPIIGTVIDHRGYTPVIVEEKPLPENVENSKPPADYKTVEELYLVGQRLEQFHNGIVDPMPYYEEALRRDPLDLRVNTVVGIRLARLGVFGCVLNIEANLPLIKNAVKFN